MELSQADKERIVKWVSDKCGVMRCTCCGMPNWEVAPIAALPIAIDLHTTRFFYSQGIPFVTVTCRNCGHTLFFNTVVIGFKPDEPAPAPPARSA